MSLNIQNLLKLKAFFDAGAPHFVLNMNVPLGSTDDETTREILRMDDVIIPEGCGTAGCIAGASFMLAEPMTDPSKIEVERSWGMVMERAMTWLGLPEGEAIEEFYGHDLFDPQFTQHEGVTPAQASIAIQRVIDGKHPWQDPDYNHAYDFAFEVISETPDGSDVTADMLRTAAQYRLNSLSNEEIMEACGLYDTHEVEK